MTLTLTLRVRVVTLTLTLTLNLAHRRGEHRLARAAAEIVEDLARYGRHPLEAARKGRGAHLAVLYPVAEHARRALRRLLLPRERVAVDRGVRGGEVRERVGVPL